MFMPQNLIHRATSGGQNNINNTWHVEEEQYKEALQPLKVYLNLELLASEETEKLRLPNIQTIRQGECYDMVVYASDTPILDVKQIELMITSDIELLLECVTNDDIYSTITIENPCHIMTYQQTALKEEVLETENYEPFHLNVPNDCSRGIVSFRLSYRKVNNKFKLSPKLATSIQIKVDGPYNSENQALQKQCYIDIDTPLPQNTAILYVAEINSNKLLITCAYEGKLLQVPPTDWIPTRLADYAKEAKASFLEQSKWTREPVKEIIGNIIKTLRSFSTHGPQKLLTWLREMLDNCNEPISVIIVDDTDFEIPWEMLEFDDEAYLGAYAAVVRWSKVQLYDTYTLLKVQDVQKQGSILAYLNDRDLGEQQTYAERKTLSTLNTNVCQMITDLMSSLAGTNALKDIGMIYIGCHGNDGVALGSRPSDRITYIDLQIPIKHPEPRPIVFVNACDSARLKQSDGLRHVFLARFACGYIGTLGQVVSTYASKIAGCILQGTLTEKDGIQIAELLRRLRAEAAEMIIQKKSVREKVSSPGFIARYEQRELTDEEKNLYFLYAFMYVYYGNPLARLKLAKKQALEDE